MCFKCCFVDNNEDIDNQSDDDDDDLLNYKHLSPSSVEYIPSSPSFQSNFISTLDAINGNNIHSTTIFFNNQDISTQVIETFELHKSKNDQGQDILNDKYILLGKTLGKGSYGNVLLAKSMHKNQYYAIKNIRKTRLKTGIEEIGENDEVNNLNNELAISKLIANQCKYIITLIEIINDPYKEHIYLIQEYLSGDTLQHWLQQHSIIDPSQKITIISSFFIDILLGLIYLHQNNIVHRDLNLNNIIIDKSGIHCKIIDFGLAYQFKNDELPLLYNTAGTILFYAPEMCIVNQMNFQYNPFKADIWALGIILYTITYNNFPFYHDNEHILYQLIENAHVTFDSKINIPNELQNLISKLLIKDITQRITLKEIINHSFIDLIFMNLSLQQQKDVQKAKEFFNQKNT